MHATEPARSAEHEDLVRRARIVSPGGSFTSMRWPVGVDDLVFVEGAGSRLRDVDGREYIDYLLGAGPTVLGHAHPAVVSAIAEQAARLVHSYMLNPTAIQLAEELVAATPGAEMIRFTDSGAEATFYALRLARAFTGREKILKFEGGYHGHHDYAMWSHRPATHSDLPTGIPDSSGIPGAIGDTVLVAPFNDHESTRTIIRTHAAELAAVITEPTPKGIEPADDFLHLLREETERLGIMLVLDEIVSGFRFRFGPQAVEYGIQPDLVTYSKIVAGGLPLGAVLGRADVMRLADPATKDIGGAYVFLSGTNYGSPVACAAGVATLQQLRAPGAYQRLGAMGERLREGARQAFAAAGIPVQVYGQGATFDFLFGEGPVRDYWSIAAGSATQRSTFLRACLDRGVLLNIPNRSFVSTAHSDEDVTRTLHVFAEAANVVASAVS